MKASLKNTASLLVNIGLLSLVISCSTPHPKDQLDKNEYGFNPAYEPIIDSIVANLSLEEKVHMIHANGLFTSGGVERLGIPDLQYTDGPNGIREELETHSWDPLNWTTDSVTFFPTGTALGATWNKDLAYRYGVAIGQEARARNKDVLLGPGVNIIRTPLCGRNFEYFSEDPYLASVLTVGYVKGVQMQDVAACVKHFAVNNQEYQRGSINVEMDERTLREIYLPVYKAAALDAETYSFMGAYNKFRGSYLCENDYLQNQVLKEEWGYKGAIISDWGATHSTVNTALNGLDVEMGRWGERSYLAKVTDSVKAGLVPEQVIDDKVHRILRIVYNCKLTDSTRVKGSMNNAANSKLAYDVAAEAIVLLKNEKNLLPLNPEEVQRIAIIGMMADKINAKGGFTAGVKSKYEVTPLEGIQNKLSDKFTLSFEPGYQEEFAVVDTGGRWPWRYPSSKPNDSLIAAAVASAKSADRVLLFVGNPRSVETEATDRVSIELPFGQDSLIKAVTTANPNTIVLVVAGAATNLSVANQYASTIAYTWYNGSENGNALADMLVGDINPSGKLPFTLPKKLEDVGAHAFGKKSYPGVNGTVLYKDSLLVGYRWFDTKNIDPAWCFGYGLSYTQFELTNAKVGKKSYSVKDKIEVTVTLENTGEFSGQEVVQIYASKPASEIKRAAQELKAFAKVSLAPGTQKKVTLSIPVEKLAYYNTTEKSWMVEPGTYQLKIGTSSRDIAKIIEVTIN